MAEILPRSNPWLQERYATQYIRLHHSDPRLSSPKDIEAVIQQLAQTLDKGGNILDLGTGQGELAEQLLETFPDTRLLALDMSALMMKEGRERLAKFGERVKYLQWDLSNEAWPSPNQTGYEPFNSFEAVVSFCTLHNLSIRRKQSLARQVLRSLKPGGKFLNLDYTRPLEEQTQRIFRFNLVDKAGIDPEILRFDDFGGQSSPTTVEDELEILRTTGFTDYDVFYHHFALKLIGGSKPQTVSGPEPIPAPD